MDENIFALDSSDEDDVYTNAAARLKALKAKKPVLEIEPEISMEEIPKEKAIEKHDISRTETLNNQRLTSQVINCGSRSRRRAAAVLVDHLFMNPSLVTIDLDASTPLQLPDNYSNDDDNVCEIIDSDPETPNTSDKNYVIDVKVRWRSREIERIKLGMNEKFAKIFQYFATLKNVPENQILLTRRDIPISHFDTPASVNLQIIDILEGGIVDTSYAANTEDTEPMCKIKVQSSSSTRNYLSYDLCKTQTFEELFEYCAKEKNVLRSKIKLSFDGEVVSASDTPDTLDLDDEACFDLQIIE
ncbi:hypothetical protein PV326_005443 [Microctonus aethiopoides]|uniref:Rad60/SUMO-like domain-containing protein n=1 Tax=Microctonus aethiopoides TaxID=144406 RepID=A0AA39FX17_9HYME|nr:hypothetical protein PV326_005443 [Microctonus aethiopoides]KAK0177420.1 hypothetical protein PV328_001476 [Microctonus aethiopoides]